MSQDSLKLLEKLDSKYIEAFKDYTSYASFRNVVSLAAFQYDMMINQYNQLEQTGNEVIKEIIDFVEQQ